MKPQSTEGKNEKYPGTTKTVHLNELIKSQCTLEKTESSLFDLFIPDNVRDIKLLVPDTLLFSNGSINYWFRTDPDGHLTKVSFDSKYLRLFQ